MGKKAYVILFIFIAINLFWLNKELFVLAKEGSERREILEQIKGDYPILPQKVVFYTESDKSYYGMAEEEKILPFQVNFGYNLLVWYSPTEYFPVEFMQRGDFIVGLTGQGYKEVVGRGFGYFRDFESLRKAVKENNLSPEFVIAYRYDSSQKLLTDISREIRSELASETPVNF